jgi:hypothetical protein|tara:strand:+ start:509 stop:1882 length:1374 start_codon:yes stop_codon:yes gene_type:complete
MTLKQEQLGEVVYKISVFRDGKLLTNSDGESDIAEFIRGVEILESITTASIEATLIVQDTAGFLGAMTGSELFKIQCIATNIDRTYFVRAYAMEARSRAKQQEDIFIVRACSDEFIKNEVTNIFGNSNTIFSGEGEASAIIKQILTDRRYLKSKKKFFGEKTINKQQFIAPNWRPFDAIYWIAQRSVRKSRKGGSLQNGFCFWENALGFHFRSIDTMISDVNNQKKGSKTSYVKNTPELYQYFYAPKSGDEGGMDFFKIQSLVFPDERNFLMGLRHGDWSGYSIGFDPVTIANSVVGGSKDLAIDAYRYSIKESWKKMEHLNGKKTKNPLQAMDTGIQAMIDYPKRVRYTMMPAQNFDPENKDNPQANYSELVELQAYQWMRIASLKNIKLIIKIPGNFDLYAGSGIEITIPATYRDGDKTPVDKRYSGRYLIASVKHDMVDNRLTTELLLLRDAVI